MSLMLKLLTLTLLLSSFAYAKSVSEKIEYFLNNEFGDNPRIKSLDVKVTDVKDVTAIKGWKAYIVDIKAVLNDKQKRVVKQKMIWFSNGVAITKELVNLNNGDNYAEEVKPNIQKHDYKKENLIYGDANAKHRVAIFSDPLCPFCKSFVPGALAEMKKKPNLYAVYYYHYPILNIHPASGIIVRAAVVAERKGVKDVAINMYSISVNPHEKNVAKILEAFNTATGAHVTQKEITSASVVAQIASDDAMAKNLFVGGTPTIYFDDKIDKTRKKYKTAQ